jgi:hypothetical protein
VTTPNDVRCATWASGDFDRALRYDAERAWRWVIAGLRNDDDAVKQIQQQTAGCPVCSLGVADYLAGACLGMLHRRWGPETALDVAQHMLVEVLSSPDIINTDPPPHGGSR